MSTDDTIDIPEPDVEELEALHERGEDDMSDAEITSKIKVSMKNKFEYPTWLTVFELSNRDGRQIDCLALNTMPSRNYPLVGFEFKASRSDWLREKKNHEKADLWVQLCDEWYVVAGRRGIVKEEELPDGWGLLELKPKGGLWKLVESDLNAAQDRDLDREFWVGFLKPTMQNESNFTARDIREAQRRGYEEAKEYLTDERVDYEVKEMADKAETVDKLKDAGLLGYLNPIDDERVERIQRARALIKAVEGDDYSDLSDRIETFRDRVEGSLSQMQSSAEGMENVLDDLQESLDETVDRRLADDGE